MEITAIEAIVEDLKEMAVTLFKKDVAELEHMKAELDQYVKAITGQIEGPSKKIADEQFEKCRVCAREWISVYCDPTYHEGVKADILKEEAVEFFFTMDEKIVAVQKKFFLLAMIDETLNPSEPFTTSQREAKIANSKIRIMAREQGLTATCKTRADTVKGCPTTDRFWYFGDERNFLQSSEAGLTDEEAIDYLLS